MKIKNQLSEIENMAEEISDKIGEEFYQELEYIGIYRIDIDHFKLDYEVRGGYDSSCKAYWGGDEYVKDIAEYIEEHYTVKSVDFIFEDEDLTGIITVEV